jgi:hypothetical protein
MQEVEQQRHAQQPMEEEKTVPLKNDEGAPRSELIRVVYLPKLI